MASNDNMPCLQAVLSIDMGSTKARAILAWRNGDKIYTRVVCFPDRAIGGHPNDGPSAILPFGNDPVKNESRDSHFQFQREKVPFKFVPFVILDKIDCMQEQDPVGIQLKKEISKVGFNEANFKADLEDACKQFLRFILLSAKETLEKNKPYSSLPIQIQTVAMPIPSQWDISFRNVYRRLVQASIAQILEQMAPVAAHDINVVFHNDATAIAHYFLHASSDAQGLDLRNRGVIPNIDAVGGGINTQLFIHCGGHHASSILTTIQRDESGQRVLSESGRSQGAEGGTEWWVENVLHSRIDQISTLTGADKRKFNPGMCDWFERQIVNELRLITRGDYKDLRYLPPPDPHYGNAGTNKLFVTKAAIDQASDVAFRHIKHMIRQQLQRVSSIKAAWATRDHTVTIIITGGSSRHFAFVTWMEELCAELSLPKPINLDSMAVFCGAAQVARGAAYATLALQARNMTAPKGPRRRIVDFGSEEGLANERRLKLLRKQSLKSFTGNIATDARLGGITQHPSNDNASSSGEASTSIQMSSASEAAGSEVGNTAGRKRKASGEPDAIVPAKLIHTTQGLPIRTAPSARKNVSSTRKNVSSTSKDGSST